jgi:DNA (cytosine-5)-methyltransferase 1
MKIGSLFSGIGGLELGLERAGVGEVVWQCEIDPFCRAVLAKHWPNVERFEDVTEEREYPAVDLICGGFPCQDVSSAGKGAGLAGEKSGLWYQFARIVEAAGPQFVIVENVTSGKKRWLPQVRQSLHLLGYRTRAFGISAADVGAPHLRRRVFVVADAVRLHIREQSGRSCGASGEATTIVGVDGEARTLADTNSERREGFGSGRLFDSERETFGDYTDGRSSTLGHAMSSGRSRTRENADQGRKESPSRGWWTSEPSMGRVAYGLPGGMDGRRRRARLRSLGNAVVPQCAEAVGRWLISNAPAVQHR